MLVLGSMNETGSRAASASVSEDRAGGGKQVGAHFALGGAESIGPAPPETPSP